MEWAHAYTLALALAAVVLLATGKAHLITVGIGLMIAVAVPGLVDVRDAVSGFANTAVVTIGALYVVGEGFLRTGAASLLASKILARTGGRESTVVFLVMVMAALLSAFVNNTLVVVTFMPVITSICRDTGLFPSRLLIPLSYASIVGGMCTLVGTSTNLLVSGVLEESGLPGMSMFEVTAPGVLLACVAMLYVGIVGRHLLPSIPSLAAQPGAQDLREYVTEITIGAGSPLIGVRADQLHSVVPGSPRAAMVIRNERVLRPPFGDVVLAKDDIVTVSGTVEHVAPLHHDPSHAATETERYRPSSMNFFEMGLAHDSQMTGRRVQDVQFKRRYGAVVVGVLRNGHHLQERVMRLRLRTGDVLLAFGDDASRERIRAASDFHLIEGVAEKIFFRDKAPTSVLIILAVVALFVTGVVHSCTAALIGAFAMVVTGCLTVSQAMRAINWPILMFIVGTIGLSHAMQETGTSAFLGGAIADALAGSGPIVLLAGIFVATILFTELVSNNAVAVLMTPVAMAAADAAGLDYRPLVMAVVFGASSSFANPLGYTTNLLVYGPGGYGFRHYLKVGLALDVLMAGVGIFLVPWFWPLE